VELDEKLALIDRWRRVILHDLDAVVALCTEDVELDYSNSIGPMKGVYRGREGLDRFGRDIRGPFSEADVEVEDTVDVAPDTVVMATRLNVKGKGSGATATSVGGFLVRFRDGKISLMKIFQSMDEALAEAKP
jgi:ketosteroid isomerase-like protein